MKLVLTEPRLTYGNRRENLAEIARVLDTVAANLSTDDIVVLPEHFDPSNDPAEYADHIVDVARRYGCHVVGGSHHAVDGASGLNRGIVAAPDGSRIGKYEKVRPYATERSLVSPGKRLADFRVAGRRVLVAICADFWFSDLFETVQELPDLVIVPALSVTRKPTPAYSQALWRHLAIARAYEFGVFVGVSDWAHTSELMALSVSGVSGFVDPTLTDPEAFFTPLRPEAIRTFQLDFESLHAFRADRIARGFFWRSGGS